MTDEPQSVPTDESVPVEEPAPASGPAPQTPPVRSRRGPALIAVGALLAVAAGGGIGYAVLQHKGDGTAAAPATAAPWTPPSPTATKAFGATSGGTHYGSLSKLLLPVPTDYSPGPDEEGYGNDVQLDAAQATAMVKADLGRMTSKNRKNAEKALAQLHIEGAGLRTYRSGDDLIIDIAIVQMRNKAAAHARTAYFTEMTKALGVFRNGPKVKGHPYATCVLPPIDPGKELDSMLCQATEGDLMVTVTVAGTVPLHKQEAADLLAKQLDRIQDPGEAV